MPLTSNHTDYYRSINGKNTLVGYMDSKSNSTLLPSGKIDLSAPNVYDYSHHQCRAVKATLGGPSGTTSLSPKWMNSTIVDLPEYASSLRSLNNEVYSRWNGKLRKGSASLGVTLASWRQTSRMITDRQNSLARGLDNVYETLRSNRSARKRILNEREPLAGQVLEGFFGWAPLISDVQAATFTAVQGAIPPEWARVTGKRSLSGRVMNQNDINALMYTDYDGVLTLTYAALVRINNPNLWLANRLGLINLPSVAWDLVPWSFVVNMFTNVGAIIGSLTDRVGIDISKESVTTKHTSLVHGFAYDYYFKCSVTETMLNTKKIRRLNVRPTLSFEVRLPKFSWSLAAIASSLVIQKIKKINTLLRII